MENQPAQIKGEVKYFNRVKGWGMVTAIPDDGKGDYFVHHSAVQVEGWRELYDGEPVLFLPCVGKKGRYAEEVVPTGRNV